LLLLAQDNLIAFSGVAVAPVNCNTFWHTAGATDSSKTPPTITAHFIAFMFPFMHDVSTQAAQIANN